MPQKPRPKRSHRLATPADHDAVEALVHAAYRPWVAVIGAVPGPMRDDYRAAIAKGQVTVLEIDGVIEAVMVLIPLDDALLIDNVATAPDVQGKGYCYQLMKQAETLALEMGYDIIRLYTHEKMEANIARYRRWGFKGYARRVERGLPRLYMEKRLGLFDF